MGDACDRRVLLVTRKYPPSVGGMETLAMALWDGITATWPDSRLISLGRSNAHLCWWLPMTVMRTALLLIRRKVDVVIAADALVATALRPALWVRRSVPCATFVMGRDLTWEFPGYRPFVKWGLSHRFARILAISTSTAAVAQQLIGDDSEICVVRLGVELPDVRPDRESARRSLEQWLGLSAAAIVVVTLGRVVPRKGAAWFAGNVLPTLHDNMVYVVAGTGPDTDRVLRCADEAGASPRLFMVGLVDDEQREWLMRGCDVFVQPNVPVSGDVEGFGLVVVEAALRGTPVVASGIEGIRDAVIDGVTGFLLPAGEAQAWSDWLTAHADRDRLAALGVRVKAAAAETFGPDQMIQRLEHIVDAL